MIFYPLSTLMLADIRHIFDTGTMDSLTEDHPLKECCNYAKTL